MKTLKFDAMLLRWSETSNGGATIVLQLVDADELEPFKAMTMVKGKMAGQILEITAELSDEGQPSPPGKGGPLSKLAARWCRDPEFQKWINQALAPPFAVGLDMNLTEDEIATSLMRSVCGVKSRAELDHDDLAAARFEAHIRRPYMDHLQSGNRFVA